MAIRIPCKVLNSESLNSSYYEDILLQFYTVIQNRCSHLPSIPSSLSDRRSCFKIALETLNSLLSYNPSTESTKRSYSPGELTQRENSYKETVQNFKLEKQSFLNDLSLFRKERRDYDRSAKENYSDYENTELKLKEINSKLEEVKKCKVDFRIMCKAQKENFRAKETELNKWEAKLVQKEKQLKQLSLTFNDMKISQEPERDLEAKYKDQLYKEFRQELKEVQNQWLLQERNYKEQLRSKDQYITMLEKQCLTTDSSKAYRKIPSRATEELTMMKEDLLSASFRLFEYENSLKYKEESLNSLEYNLQNETQDIENAAYMFETINQELEDKRNFLNETEAHMEKAWLEIKQASDKLTQREQTLQHKEKDYKERLHQLETREALVKEKKKGLKKLEKVLEVKTSNSSEFSPYIERYEKCLSKQREQIAREKLEIERAKLELMRLKHKSSDSDFLSTEDAAYQLQKINQLLQESNGFSLLPLSTERLSIK